MDFQEKKIDSLKKSSKRKTEADLTTLSSPNAKKRRTEILVHNIDVKELSPVPEERDDLISVEALSSTRMLVVEQPMNEKSPQPPSEVESTESIQYDSSDRKTGVDIEMQKRIWKIEIAKTVKDALHLFYKKEIEKKEDFEGAAKTFTEMFLTTALVLAAENRNFTLSSTFLKETVQKHLNCKLGKKKTSLTILLHICTHMPNSVGNDGVGQVHIFPNLLFLS